MHQRYRRHLRLIATLQLIWVVSCGSNDDPAPPPTATLAADPTVVKEGETTSLTWSSQNASTCTASGAWSGSKATSGTEASPALTDIGNKTFTLVCSGNGGSVTATASVTVEQQSQATSNVGSTGGVVELANVARVEFPAGSLTGAEVVVQQIESAEFANDFTQTAAPLFDSTIQNSYQIAIQITGEQPTAPVEVTLKVPDELKASAPPNSELRVFYTLYQISEDEREKTIEALSDRFSSSSNEVSVELPPEAFSDDATNNSGLYQAVLFLAFTPTGSSADPASTGPFSKARINAASDNDSGQCEGSSLKYPVDPNTPVKSGFGTRTHPITGKVTGHAGVDFGVSDGTPVLAMAEGKIEISSYQFNSTDSTGWGYYVVVKHTDGSKSLYAHLTKDTALAAGTPVVAGTQIGLSDTSGGATGPHLHVEYAPNGNIYEKASKTDPLACMGAETDGSISVGDNGTAADDAFIVSLNGAKICETAIGATNNCSLGKLRSGQYSLTLLCTIAPDDTGTYGISLSNGLTFADGSSSTSGVLTQGSSTTFTIIAPSTNVAP